MLPPFTISYQYVHQIGERMLVNSNCKRDRLTRGLVAITVASSAWNAASGFS